MIITVSCVCSFALYLLEWDESRMVILLQNRKDSKAIFDKKYFDLTVSIASDLLGKPKFTFTESKPFQSSSSLRKKENALIF